ncbi:MAG: N-acetylmuramic acid 6-phosphate etherase [Clostridiaceae bacterium]|nr:N-acetylmuramic acid 6-phosphate etherase [Clostridiaceae bacterium]
MEKFSNTDFERSPDSTEEMNLLQTEQINPLTRNLDTMSTLEMVQTMNRLDREVPQKVGEEAAAIAQAIDMVVYHFKAGGRLIYAGAGTSGRLGILDASECPPTFGVSPDLVSGIIAGGQDAVFKAMEGVEDREEQAVADLEARRLSAKDVVLAIASSGRTPYCIGALKYAAITGAGRIALSCNKHALLSRYAEIVIEVESGPEIIMGSTRLKAGTAQKMVLNMISSLSMVKMGHVYQNLMVGTRGINQKLSRRVLRIFTEATGNPDLEHAARMLEAAGGVIKTAIVMELMSVSRKIAEQALQNTNGYVRQALLYISGQQKR